MRLFLCPLSMAGAAWALRSAAPRSGKANHSVPATLSISLDGGGLQSEGLSMPSSPVALFWAKVNRSNHDSCWIWQGAVSSNGYGTVSWDGKICGAHRVAAFLSGIIRAPFWNSSRTEKTLVLHKCDNPLCCNPSHLFSGNFQDNSDDCKEKNRMVIKRGEDHHSAKLTNEIAERIRYSFAYDYASVNDLARQYGVTNTAIAKIVYGETYKYVGGPIAVRPSKPISKGLTHART